MAMGILGQLVTNADATVPTLVYTVPSGKVAVFNIFAASTTTGITSGSVEINDATVGIIHNLTGADSISLNLELKSIIGNAGTTVKFKNCTGVVTGYEEDA